MDKPKYALGTDVLGQNIKFWAILVISGLTNFIGVFFGITLLVQNQLPFPCLVGVGILVNLALLGWVRRDNNLMMAQAIGAGVAIVGAIIIMLILAYIFRNLTFSGLIFM